MKELEQKKDDLQKLLNTLEIIRDPQKIKELSIELSKIERQIKNAEEINRLETEIKDLREILAGDDEELKVVAKNELAILEKKKEELTKKTKKGKEELPQNVIMEIRAGAGGEEASLFAAELFGMYGNFAKKLGWEVTILDESKSNLGGYKELVFEINGEGAYQKLRWESGVHRVQRIPETEKIGRIHTSTASVAVLPQAKEIDIEIKPQDLKIEFFRSSGPGGQNVNKVETAVRIYHLPSGFAVSSQESRSQQKNREKAMTILRAKLLDIKMREEQKKIAAERKQQIGTADRSEKIRTYNFPQDRITDHRIKESWHNISSILAGNLDQIVATFDKL